MGTSSIQNGGFGGAPSVYDEEISAAPSTALPLQHEAQLAKEFFTAKWNQLSQSVSFPKIAGLFGGLAGLACATQQIGATGKANSPTPPPDEAGLSPTERFARHLAYDQQFSTVPYKDLVISPNEDTVSFINGKNRVMEQWLHPDQDKANMLKIPPASKVTYQLEGYIQKNKSLPRVRTITLELPPSHQSIDIFGIEVPGSSKVVLQYSHVYHLRILPAQDVNIYGIPCKAHHLAFVNTQDRSVYCQMPAMTREAFTQNSWYHNGDPLGFAGGSALHRYEGKILEGALMVSEKNPIVWNQQKFNFSKAYLYGHIIAGILDSEHSIDFMGKTVRLMKGAYVELPDTGKAPIAFAGILQNAVKHESIDAQAGDLLVYSGYAKKTHEQFPKFRLLISSPRTIENKNYPVYSALTFDLQGKQVISRSIPTPPADSTLVLKKPSPLLWNIIEELEYVCSLRDGKDCHSAHYGEDEIPNPLERRSRLIHGWTFEHSSVPNWIY